MHLVRLIPSALALVIAGTLLGTQRQKISRLKNESVLLRKLIVEEKTRGSNPDPSQPVEPDHSSEEIDWNEAAEFIAEMQNGSGVRDNRRMRTFQSKLWEMDTEQLLAALDKIRTLQLGEEKRLTLESMLIAPLARQDPELALNRFSDRINEQQSGMNSKLANVFGQWATKDREAAIAWFDKEIASGTFDSKSLDGKSASRFIFEKSLVATILSDDPATAQARIAALPADQRRYVLHSYDFQRLGVEKQAAYADIARSQLSEEESRQIFGIQATLIAMTGDLEEVGSYLDRIGSTGEERTETSEKAAAGNIAGKAHRSEVTVEQIDSMREWLSTQSPNSVERITGEVLGQIANRNGPTKFPEAADMLLEYHARNGGDDLLSGFLNHTQNQGDKEQSRRIAERISDPEMREKALGKLK